VRAHRDAVEVQRAADSIREIGRGGEHRPGTAEEPGPVPPPLGGATT
jgi:hypothetical protein